MRFILIIYLMQFYCCKCDSRKEFTFYGSTRIKTIVEKDCDNNILKFESYQFDSTCLAFELLYSKGQPDSMCGGPWVHLIQNKADYYVGDTIELIVDVAEPPLLESEFSISDNDGNAKFVIIDHFNFKWTDNGKDEEHLVPGRYYKFQTVVNDTLEEIKIKNTFFYLDKEWATVTRTEKFRGLTNNFMIGSR